MTTPDPLVPAMRDALAVLTACEDATDSFALTRDTLLSAVHDRYPADHVAGAVRLLQGFVGVSTLLLSELARTSGLTDQQLLHQLGTTLARA